MIIMRNKKYNSKIGSWITLNNPSLVELLSKVGFDWLTIDLEHSSITIEKAEELIRIISLSKVKPYVRLTSINTEQIRRVLDAGAQGLIAPLVKNKDDVKKLLNAAYYPPVGERGVGLARAQGYGSDFEKYKSNYHKDLDIFVQIEHIEAVRNLEEIFNNKRIRGYFIGPYDLSFSMLKPGKFKDKKFIETIKYIKKIAKKYNVKSGIHIVEPNLDELKKIIKEKYDYIGYSLDIRVLDVNYRNALDIFKNQTKR